MQDNNSITNKTETWFKIEAILEKAGANENLSSLTPEELKSLLPLYRRVSSDLSAAKTINSDPDTILYLNKLVAKVHSMLYASERSAGVLQSIWTFYAITFPTLLQKRKSYFISAWIITLLGVLFAYQVVIHHPNDIWKFIPPSFKSSVHYWKEKKIAQPPSATFSGGLMTHNQMVGIMAFAVGMFACVPTIYLLFQNGVMLGALAALMTQVHGHATFWPGILPHGIAELTAIMICGGAGMQMGLALLKPAPYKRTVALAMAANEAIQLVLGTLPLFIFAGLIEGMFSHLNIAAWIRLSFAGINGIFWYLYLFVPRKQPVDPLAGEDTGTVSTVDAYN